MPSKLRMQTLPTAGICIGVQSETASGGGMKKQTGGAVAGSRPSVRFIGD
jgi:hypothetical protein